MKILVLILASSGYDGFYALWRKYMKTHTDIDCYFYRGDPNMETDAKIVNDTIYVKIEDTLDTVYEKLMLTLKFLEPQFDKYDFLLRTNLSSVIDFDNYVKFCSLLPVTNVCAAVMSAHEKIVFPSGAGFTLSMDLVRRLLKENPPLVYLDDVTIGCAMSKWNIQYIRANRIDYKSNGVWVYEHRPSPNEIIFHYRAKTDNRDEDYRVLGEVLRNIVNPLLLVNRS